MRSAIGIMMKRCAKISRACQYVAVESVIRDAAIDSFDSLTRSFVRRCGNRARSALLLGSPLSVH